MSTHQEMFYRQRRIRTILGLQELTTWLGDKTCKRAFDLDPTSGKRDFQPWSGSEKTFQRMRVLELTLREKLDETDNEKELEIYTKMRKMALP